MTEGRNPKPAEETTAVATAAKQRRKRKWDQPAESLLSAGLSLTRTFPLGANGITGIPPPAVIPLPAAVLTTPLQVHHSPDMSQNSATVVQKATQSKIPDELIAREIVINDAEPTVRFILTKRQTQDEIQRATGAVVITRGKFRSSDTMADSEKPVYLHISAGAHLKDTAERIIAVDRAAFMVEEILKQGQSSVSAVTISHSATSNGHASNDQATQSLSTSLFLGFEVDPSLNVAARIRGPNDQYINHIMNETGANVVLRGKGSGNLENSLAEEVQQPLHLYISSAHSKNLEAARILAENLLDTISAECGASRISSCKLYPAVPPQHILSKLQSSGEMLHMNANPVALPSTPNGGVPNYVNPQPHIANFLYPIVNGGTCYNGYGGIYPQATPLQQVALALKTSHAPSTSTLASTTSSSIAEIEKQPSQKRKFQELPVASKETPTNYQKLFQGSEVKNVPTMPPPKKLVHMEFDWMPPPPPPQTKLPPPKFTGPQTPTLAPPKFDSHSSTPEIAICPDSDKTDSNKETISDILLKLVEYGEEEDDDDGTEALGEESVKSNLTQKLSSKPFWAV